MSENFSGNTPENIAEQASLEQQEILDVIEDVDFDYEGYQVVRGEYFAHIYEPSITFNHSKVYLNTASIKKLPDIDYVQILVNSEEKNWQLDHAKKRKKVPFYGVPLKESQNK